MGPVWETTWHEEKRVDLEYLVQRAHSCDDRCSHAVIFFVVIFLMLLKGDLA